MGLGPFRVLLAVASTALVAFIQVGAAEAVAIYRDKPTYLSAVGTTASATFEDSTAGQTPVVSGGISFSGPGVVEGLVNVPYQFWFGDMGSPPRFALMGLTPNVGFGFQATFPADVIASGFIFNCFACSNTVNGSRFTWTLLDAGGNVVEQGSEVVNFFSPSGEPPPGFLGIVSSRPFRSFKVTRDAEGTPPVFGNWVADDIRYSVALPASAVVPALTDWALATTALLLLALGGVVLHRRAHARGV